MRLEMEMGQIGDLAKRGWFFRVMSGIVVFIEALVF